MKTCLVIILIVICLQHGEAKKRKPATTLESATKTISLFLKDITDFFGDVMNTITEYLGFQDSPKNEPSKPTGNWSMNNIMKYAANTMRSGYRVIGDAIPILRLARSTMDEIAPILPNMSLSDFVKVVLQNIVPELMNKQTTEVIQT